MLVELRGVVVGDRRVGVEAALLTVLVLAQQFGRLTFLHILIAPLPLPAAAFHQWRRAWMKIAAPSCCSTPGWIA